MAYSNSKLGLITLQKVVIGRLTDPLWYSSIPPNDERISTDQRFGFHCGHMDCFLLFQVVLWFFKSGLLNKNAGRFQKIKQSSYKTSLIWDLSSLLAMMLIILMLLISSGLSNSLSHNMLLMLTLMSHNLTLNSRIFGEKKFPNPYSQLNG